MAETDTTDRKNELVDEELKFHGDCLRATRALARSKPWRLSHNDRREQLEVWLATCEAAYNLKPITLRHDGSPWGDSGASCVSDDGRMITLTGRLSVVTMFMLFRQATYLQRGRRLAADAHLPAMVWAATLFKRKFPISFGRCHLDEGGMLRNRGLEQRELEQRQAVGE